MHLITSIYFVVKNMYIEEKPLRHSIYVEIYSFDLEKAMQKAIIEILGRGFDKRFLKSVP